jgi:glycosyltransferase involved in cell wall biosynthesis
MKILILTQYFPPEIGAAQNRLGDLASRLSAAGHSVTVLTSLPSYPRGEFFEGFRGKLFMIQNANGVRILRTWLYATKKKSFLPRILNYLSFSVLSSIVGLFAGGADAVLVESPPLFLGVSGYIVSKMKKAKFVLNISDLWPESAVAVGMLRNQRLIRWATVLEEFLYRRATLVTGQTQGIVDSIHRRCPGTDAALLTNGVTPEFIQLAEHGRVQREGIRLELGVRGKFVVGYAGLHGLVYGLDDVLEVAKFVSDVNGIAFVLIGDGPEKARLQEKARRQKISNLSFHSSQPAGRMPEILAAMDVSLITLKSHEFFKGTLPSKLFEAMGAGIPIVAAMEGEARALIKRANCGICVEPGNQEEIASAVLCLYRDPLLGKQLGENGRQYVAVHYNRKLIAERFETLLLANMPELAGNSSESGILQARK